jgi:hypothetical protein
MKRAMASAVRIGQKEQAIADHSEEVLSKALGIPRTRDNSAFDLLNDDVGIEVKTILVGKNAKITMSHTALGRKLAEQQAEGIRGYTIVADRRTGGKATQGFGSFHLAHMQKATLPELKELVQK